MVQVVCCFRVSLPKCKNVETFQCSTIADEKTVGPFTNIEYLGLTIDSDELLVKIPQGKIEKLQDQLTTVLSNRKVTLKEMQSLTGSLAFCTRALLLKK
jgi:hypothetical protein